METYLYTLTAIVLLVTLLFYYFNWAFSYWKRRGVVCAPTRVPFGSASKTIRGKLAFGLLLKEVYDHFKEQKLRYVGFYTFTKPALIILDVNIIKQILVNDFQYFTDRAFYVNEKNEPLTGHLFGIKGEKWRNLRTKLTPAFSSAQTRNMLPTLLGYSNSLQNVLDNAAKKEGVIDGKDLAVRYICDVIGSCCFGLEFDSLNNPNSAFRKYGNEIVNAGYVREFIRLLSFLVPEIVKKLGLNFFSKYVTNFTLSFVKDTIEFRETNNIKRNDFLHLLMQIKNNVAIEGNKDAQSLKNLERNLNVNGGLTFEQVAAQVLFFYVAGFDTTSSTLTFCLFELATNLVIQEELQYEIKTVLGKHKNNITYDALKEMVYMDKCIKETLRKYPPLPELFRECTKRYTIPDSTLTIEKGTNIYIPLMGIQGDPEFYPDPEMFDPERFSEEIKATRPDFAWMPFGKGPRVCIGKYLHSTKCMTYYASAAQRFGVMQIKVALTVMLKDYKFTLNEKTKVPLTIVPEQTTLSVKGGVWLNMEKLEKITQER